MGQGHGSLFLTKLTNHLDLLYNIKKLLPDTKSDRCQLKISIKKNPKSVINIDNLSSKNNENFRKPVILMP